MQLNKGQEQFLQDLTKKSAPITASGEALAKMIVRFLSIGDCEQQEKDKARAVKLCEALISKGRPDSYIKSQLSLRDYYKRASAADPLVFSEIMVKAQENLKSK